MYLTDVDSFQGGAHINVPEPTFVESDYFYCKQKGVLEYFCNFSLTSTGALSVVELYLIN